MQCQCKVLVRLLDFIHPHYMITNSTFQAWVLANCNIQGDNFVQTPDTAPNYDVETGKFTKT